jgi:hypothetical protein
VFRTARGRNQHRSKYCNAQANNTAQNSPGRRRRRQNEATTVPIYTPAAHAELLFVEDEPQHEVEPDNCLPAPWNSITLEDVAGLPEPPALLTSILSKALARAAKRTAQLALGDGSKAIDVRYVKLFLALPKLCICRSLKSWARVAYQALEAFPAALPSHVRRLKRHAIRQRRTFVQSPDGTLPAPVLRRVWKAILERTGSISKAMRVFSADKVAPGTDADLAQLEALHPQPTPSHVPHIPTHKGFKATVTDVMVAMSGMPVSTGNGYTGWSVRLAKAAMELTPAAMVKDDAGELKGNAVVQLLSHMITSAAHGRPLERAWMLAARLIPLRKPNLKLRPIACGEIFARLASRIALKKMTIKAAAAVLQPCQWGVGSGAEEVIHRIRLKFSNGYATHGWKFDLANCFNNISRHAFMHEVRAKMPELYEFVYWRYGDPTRLLVSRATGGIATLWSSCGSQQGEPLAGWLMSLLFAPFIKKLMAACPGIDVDAYFDDLIVTAVCTSDAEADALQAKMLAVMASPDWEAAGFFVEPTKTARFTSATSIEILGAYFGTADDVSDAMYDKVEATCARLAQLQQLDKQSALLVLRMCALPAIQFYLRTTAPALVRHATSIFDIWVLGQLAGLADVQALGPMAEQVAQLPLREGGLGMYSQMKLSELAYAASLTKACCELRNRGPARSALATATQSTGVADDVTLAATVQQANLPCVTKLCRLIDTTPAELWAHTSIHKFRGLQHTATVAVGATWWRTAFLSATAIEQYRLVDFGSRLGRAWMYAVPTHPSRVFADADIRLHLRYRLGEAMNEYAPRGTINDMCACGDHRPNQYAEHALRCTLSEVASARTRRHESIKHGLQDLFQRAGAKVQTEPAVGSGRTDLCVTGLEGSGTLYLDVSVVAPAKKYTTPDADPVTERELDTAIERYLASRPTRANSAPTTVTNVPLLVARKRLVTEAIGVRERAKNGLYKDAVAGDLTAAARQGTFYPCVLSAGGTMSAVMAKLVADTTKLIWQKRAQSTTDAGELSSNRNARAIMTQSAYQVLSRGLALNFKSFFNNGITLV